MHASCFIFYIYFLLRNGLRQMLVACLAFNAFIFYAFIYKKIHTLAPNAFAFNQHNATLNGLYHFVYPYIYIFLSKFYRHYIRWIPISLHICVVGELSSIRLPKHFTCSEVRSGHPYLAAIRGLFRPTCHLTPFSLIWGDTLCTLTCLWQLQLLHKYIFRIFHTPPHTITLSRFSSQVFVEILASSSSTIKYFWIQNTFLMHFNVRREYLSVEKPQEFCLLFSGKMHFPISFTLATDFSWQPISAKNSINSLYFSFFFFPQLPKKNFLSQNVTRSFELYVGRLLLCFIT